MATYLVQFLDGEKREVSAFNFSCAKVIAAYRRMTDENAQTHTELCIDESKKFPIKLEKNQ
jgi:hypothetical protein